MRFENDGSVATLKRNEIISFKESVMRFFNNREKVSVFDFSFYYMILYFCLSVSRVLS